MEAHARGSNGTSDTASPPPFGQDGDSSYEADSVASAPAPKRRKTTNKKATDVAAATASPNGFKDGEQEAGAAAAPQASPRNTLSELAAIAAHTAQQQQTSHLHTTQVGGPSGSSSAAGLGLQAGPHAHAPHSSHAHHHHHHAVPHTHVPHAHTHAPSHGHRHAAPPTLPMLANLDVPLSSSTISLRDLTHLRDSLRDELVSARDQMIRLDAFVKRGDGIVHVLEAAIAHSSTEGSAPLPQVSSETPLAPTSRSANEEDDYESYLRSLPAMEAVKLPSRSAASASQPDRTPAGAGIKREGSAPGPA